MPRVGSGKGSPKPALRQTICRHGRPEIVRDVQSPKGSSVSHPGSVQDAGFLATGRGTAQNREQRRQRVPPPRSDRSVRRNIYCYTCREKRHMSFKCPKNTGLYCDESSEPRWPVERPTSGEVYRSGRVNGINIVLDTRASRTWCRKILSRNVPSGMVR